MVNPKGRGSGNRTRPPQRIDRLPLGHPEVVTVEHVPEEEFDYAEAALLVVEWR